jgi:hypothetical protein
MHLRIRGTYNDAINDLIDFQQASIVTYRLKWQSGYFGCQGYHQLLSYILFVDCHKSDVIKLNVGLVTPCLFM